MGLLQPVYIKGNLTNACTATNFPYCSLHTISFSLHRLSNLCFPLGSFSPGNFFLFWVSVLNVHVLGQMLLLASDTSVPRHCRQLGAASFGTTKPRPQPLQRSCKGVLQCPSTSDELGEQHASTKHLLSLAQPLLVSSGSSFSTDRGAKESQVAVLTKEDALQLYPLECLSGLLKLTLPPYR